MPRDRATLIRSGILAAAVGMVLLILEAAPPKPVHKLPEYTPIPSAPLERCAAKSEECFTRRSAPESVYSAQLDLAAARYERQRSLRQEMRANKAIPRGAHVFSLFPPVLSCPFAERVGRFGDGGKWLCEPQKLPADCLVYSAGGSTDLSFELEMHRRYGCQTHTFDPSPGLLEQMKPELEQGMFYHALGLGPTTDDPKAADPFELIIAGVKVPVKTLSTIAEQLGTKRVDVLKLDIESSEWGALPQLISEGMLEKLQVRQLQIEFHWPLLEQLETIFDSLYAHGYVAFAAEANFFDPACAEYAFVHRNYLTAH